MVVGSNLGGDGFFYVLILFLVIGYAGSFLLFTNLSCLVLMVVCIVFFSLSSSEGRIGPVLGPPEGAKAWPDLSLAHPTCPLLRRTGCPTLVDCFTWRETQWRSA